jgi:glycosyltransferase involved in cell wall biosynthesis
MKIIYVSDSAIPSSSPNIVHVMKMCQAFADLGHKVTLVAKNTTACIKDVKDVHEFYAVKKKFNVEIFPGVAFKGSGAYYNLSLIWRVLGWSADLVYTRSITAAYILLLLGRPVVFEVHEPYEGKGSRLRWMFQFIIRSKKLQKLVVISEALKAYYVQKFALQSDLILVCHDGADPFRQANPVIVNHNFKIGYVGSLLVGKGMEILIPLAKKCSKTEFHVVGGSEQQIRDCAEKAGHLANLIFHGFKSQQELPGYIVSFDAVIAPYTTVVKVNEKKGANNLALWMSPLKVFEYMSAGKPIVASRLDVIGEILQHESTALLCDPQDLEEWALAIDRLQRDGELRKKLGDNAQADFEHQYTWRKRAERILACLEHSKST